MTEAEAIKSYIKFFMTKLPKNSEAHLFLTSLLKDLQYNFHRIPRGL